jgi:type IV secretory pathway VirB10-like protein
MTSVPRADGTDAERDAVLLAALRHAPDAALEPPTAVSTRILAQASAAARGSASGTSRPWRRTSATGLAGWLAPRAPWAAALGTIAAATLVGVLWSSRQPEVEDSGAPPAPGAAPTAPPAQPPAPAAPTAAAPQAADAAPPPAPRARMASPEVQRNAAAAEKALPPSADAAAPRESRSAALAASADPSVRLDAALRAAALDAAVWRHAGRVHAHGSEQRLWWSQVGDATQGRWQAVTEARGDLPPGWIVLSIGGERTAAFWFVGDVLWLRDRAGVWRVPVGAEQRRAWQTAPQRW